MRLDIATIFVMNMNILLTLIKIDIYVSTAEIFFQNTVRIKPNVKEVFPLIEITMVLHLF